MRKLLTIGCSLGLTACAAIQPADPGLARDAVLSKSEPAVIIDHRLDEFTLIDSRTIRAWLRAREASPGVGYLRTGRWIGIGLGILAAGILIREANEVVEDVGNCFPFRTADCATQP